MNEKLIEIKENSILLDFEFEDNEYVVIAGETYEIDGTTYIAEKVELDENNYILKAISDDNTYEKLKNMLDELNNDIEEEEN